MPEQIFKCQRCGKTKIYPRNSYPVYCKGKTGAKIVDVSYPSPGNNTIVFCGGWMFPEKEGPF